MYTKYKKTYSWIKDINITEVANKRPLLIITTEQDNHIHTFHYTEDQLDNLYEHFENNTLCELLVTKRSDDTLWVRL